MGVAMMSKWEKKNSRLNSKLGNTTWLQSIEDTNPLNLDGNFINAVIASFNDPKRRQGNTKGLAYMKGKQAEFARRSVQRNLMGATKFFIDDTLLEHAVAASFVAPKDFLIAMETAIPPVDNMWIEWNEHQRLRIVERWHHKFGLDLDGKNYESGSANYMGYHITKQDLANAYLYSNYFAFTNETNEPERKEYLNKICFQHFGFLMRNDDILRIEDCNNHIKKHHNALMGENMNLSMYQKEFDEVQETQGEMLYGMLYKSFFEKTPRKYIDELYKRVYMIPHEGIDTLLNSKEDHWFLNQPELTENSAIASAGDARFLASVISLLNYPNLIKKRNAKPVRHQKMWGNRLPSNEVRTIEIDLPKPRGVTMYSKMYRGLGSPKRYHLRRGHFNHYRLKDGSLRKVWIPERYVGNKELGVIEHEYKLQSAFTVS